MALSHINADTAQANNVTFTTNPSAGDIIIVFAYRDGGINAPTQDGTWYNLYNATGANSNSHYIGYKISDGTETGTGTFTNATSIATITLRGSRGPVYAVLYSGSAAGGANSNSMSYNTITMNVSDGTSFVLGFGGHRTATNVGTNAPSGMTLRSSATDVAVFSIDGATSWSSQSAGVNATSGWRTHVLEIQAATPPTVTTSAVSSIADTTATGNGNCTATGYSTVTDRGVCWKTSTGPTISDSYAGGSGQTGSYTRSMTGLAAGTHYYVRAYATNAYGTSYGSEVEFDSLPNAVASSFIASGTLSPNIDGVGAVATVLSASGIMTADIGSAAAATDVDADFIGSGAFAPAISGIGAVAAEMVASGTLVPAIGGIGAVATAAVVSGTLTPAISGVGAIAAAMVASGTLAPNIAGVGAVATALSASGTMVADVQSATVANIECAFVGGAAATAAVAGVGEVASAFVASLAATPAVAGVGAVAAAFTASATFTPGLSALAVIDAAFAGGGIFVPDLAGIGGVSTALVGSGTMTATIHNPALDDFYATFGVSGTMTAAITGVGDVEAHFGTGGSGGTGEYAAAWVG